MGLGDGIGEATIGVGNAAVEAGTVSVGVGVFTQPETSNNAQINRSTSQRAENGLINMPLLYYFSRIAISGQ